MFEVLFNECPTPPMKLSLYSTEHKSSSSLVYVRGSGFEPRCEPHN